MRLKAIVLHQATNVCSAGNLGVLPCATGPKCDWFCTCFGVDDISDDPDCFDNVNDRIWLRLGTSTAWDPCDAA
jgi:hypothetical protein